VMDVQGYSALIGISALRVVLMVSACGVLCGAMLRGLRAAA
jgi:hypothetical protein